MKTRNNRFYRKDINIDLDKYGHNKNKNQMNYLQMVNFWHLRPALLIGHHPLIYLKSKENGRYN